MIEKGLYRHFKGKEYLVIGEGIHTETREAIVLYKAFYGSEEEREKIYLRPKKMFEEEIVSKDGLVKRFERIEE